MGPVSTIVNTFPALGQGLVALRKLEALGLSMSEEPLAKDERELATAAKQPGVLELIGVTHRYRSENGEPGFTLGPLDLRIEPGELVFVTGGNGNRQDDGGLPFAWPFLSRKGRDYAERGTHRKGSMGRLSAEFCGGLRRCFRLRDSARLWRCAIGARKPRSCSSTCELGHKLAIRDGRFSTVDLSRGQRKRLALLAAFIEDRPFYLFDEWAAEQDPIFREIFYTNMLPELRARGKTVIVITA